MNQDPLTGLMNRRAFSAIMDTAMSFSRRSHLPLALAMMDLDHFKFVNDTYGHIVGDELLTATAKVLRSCCRLEDSVCRFGGEEFIVLLPNTSLEKAVAFCERVRQGVPELTHQPSDAPPASA